jgi:hypothetical protein
MKETKISLQQDLPKPEKDSLYFIDWGKVTSVNDLFLIIAALGVSFSPQHPAWDMLKHLMDYSNPVKPNTPQITPKIDLPKLKTLK